MDRLTSRHHRVARAVKKTVNKWKKTVNKLL
jgi:hypothetical protein